jgi:AcrR family transcriptional regulator
MDGTGRLNTAFEAVRAVQRTGSVKEPEPAPSFGTCPSAARVVAGREGPLRMPACAHALISLARSRPGGYNKTVVVRYRIVHSVERQEPMPRRSSTPGRTRSEEQVLRSKAAVLKTTFQLLMDNGLGGVSVDEVAKRSGVAKTTIYRHWPSRAELLLDACSKLGAKFDAPDTGTLRGDVMEIASGIAARLRAKNFSSVMPSIIDAAERDNQIAALQARIHADTLAPLYAALDRAKTKGELPRNCVTTDIVAALVGPIFYRRWFSREPLDDRFVKSVVMRALGGGD